MLLTTRYLEEVDHLAAQLVIIDQGRVVAAGSPDQLKNTLGGDTVHGQPSRSPVSHRTGISATQAR